MNKYQMRYKAQRLAQDIYRETGIAPKAHDMSDAKKRDGWDDLPPAPRLTHNGGEATITIYPKTAFRSRVVIASNEQPTQPKNGIGGKRETSGSIENDVLHADVPSVFARFLDRCKPK